MKKPLVKLLSVILAASCVLGLAGAFGTVGNVMDAKDYWEEVADNGHTQFNTMQDGIEQLRTNEPTYLAGVDSYAAGLAEYNTGKKTLEDGKAELAKGKTKLSDGQKQYSDGLEQYNQGLADYNAGIAKLEAAEKQLEEKKADYEVGKEKLQQVELIYNICMGIVNEIETREQDYARAVSNGNTVIAELYRAEIQTLKATLNVQLAGYSIEGIIKEYQDGQEQVKLYEDTQKMVTEGKAKLAENRKKLDDAEVKIAAAQQEIANGKISVADGEKEVADGEKKLAEGETSLADGKSQLQVFEDGEKQLADGIDTAMELETYFTADGEKILDSIADRLSDTFTYWQLDNNGNAKVVNDNKLIDLDKAQAVHDAGLDFMEDCEVEVTAELTKRIIAAAAAVIASAAGILAAVFGLLGKVKPASTLGLISAGAGVAGLLYAALKGMENPLSKVAGANGAIPTVTILLILAAAAVLFSLVSLIAVENSEKKTEIAE